MLAIAKADLNVYKQSEKLIPKYTKTAAVAENPGLLGSVRPRAASRQPAQNQSKMARPLATKRPAALDKKGHRITYTGEQVVQGMKGLLIPYHPTFRGTHSGIFSGVWPRTASEITCCSLARGAVPALVYLLMMCFASGFFVLSYSLWWAGK